MDHDHQDIQEDTQIFLGAWAEHIDTHLREVWGDQVQNGPFAGQTVLSLQPGSFASLYLIGSYEEELHQIVAALPLHGPFSQLVNVGSSEGYYTVGLARLIPDVPSLAFDADPTAHPTLAANAKANGVSERITQLGLCRPDDLRAHLEHKALVCMDCEGAEDVLLDPDTIPTLRSATILVELHDCYQPGVSERVLKRFEDSHTCQRLYPQSRDPYAYPQTKDMPQFLQALAVCEYRPFGTD